MSPLPSRARPRLARASARISADRPLSSLRRVQAAILRSESPGIRQVSASPSAARATPVSSNAANSNAKYRIARCTSLQQIEHAALGRLGLGLGLAGAERFQGVPRHGALGRFEADRFA